MSWWGSLFGWLLKALPFVSTEGGIGEIRPTISSLRTAATIGSIAQAVFSARGIIDKLTPDRQSQIVAAVNPVYQSRMGSWDIPFQNINITSLADAISAESNFVGSKFGDIQGPFSAALQSLQAGDFDSSINSMNAAYAKTNEFLDIHLPSAEEDEDISPGLISDLRSASNQIKSIIDYNRNSITGFRTNYQQFVESTARQEAEKVAQLAAVSSPSTPPSPAPAPTLTVDTAELERLRTESEQRRIQLEQLRAQETQRLQIEQKRQEDITVMSEDLLSAIEGLFTEGKKQGLAPIFSEAGPFRGELRGFAPIPKLDETLGTSSETLAAFSPQFGALQAMKAGTELKPYAEALTSPIAPDTVGLGVQAINYAKLKELFPDESIQQAAAERAESNIDWSSLMSGLSPIGAGFAGALLGGTRGMAATGYSGVPMSSVYDTSGISSGQLRSISPERLTTQQQAQTLGNLMPTILTSANRRLQQPATRPAGMPQFAFPFLDDDFTFLATLARMGVI